MKEETEIWIKKADEDFRAVELLLQYNDSPASVICFHCQQAAEKYLKAYLVDHEVEFPRTHDLILLIEGFILKFDNSFNEFTEIAGSLNEYAIASRYPYSDENFDIQVAREAFIAANLLRTTVLGKISPSATSTLSATPNDSDI